MAMVEPDTRLKYRKRGALAWRELTPGAMPAHGELWEVKSPDGSVALLSRSDAPLPAAPHPVEETDSFHLEFAQEDPARPRLDLPVATLKALGEDGRTGAPSSHISCPPDFAAPQAFGVLVEGNSLEPKFSAGQVVLVDPGRSPDDGDWAVVGTARDGVRIARWRVKKSDRVTLESPKPAARPLEIAADQVRFAFKILWAKEP